MFTGVRAAVMRPPVSRTGGFSRLLAQHPTRGLVTTSALAPRPAAALSRQGPVCTWALKHNGAEVAVLQSKSSSLSPITRRWMSTNDNDGKDGGDSTGGNAGSSSDVESAMESPPGMGNGNQTPNAVAVMEVPKVYPEVLVIPVDRSPLFPNFLKQVTITDDKLAEALKVMVERGTPYAGAFLKKDSEPTAEDILQDAAKASSEASGVENETFEGESTVDKSSVHPNVYDVGCFVSVTRITGSSENGAINVLLQAHRRIEIEDFIEGTDPRKAKVKNLLPKPYDMSDDVTRATSQAVVTTLKDLLRKSPMFRDSFTIHQANLDVADPAVLSDFAAAMTSADSQELQDALEEMDINERLNKVLVLLKKELVATKLQEKISRDVEEKVTKQQRRYLLMEQLKKIKHELGIEKDDKETLVEKFRTRLKELHPPEAVSQTIEEEMNKLQHLETHSSEFSVTRNYLDWLTTMPWGIYSEENLNVKRAQEILDEDHYGLKDIKERILEFIAVAQLKGTTQGKILTFIGPPGVGKTSIAHSIARALDRSFYRFSVGGMTDVAEIKGHRRTYVGAMPGKPIQALKKTKTENPLILIDEIDKLGRGYQGDPASALLELLDPEQNSGFLDHYMDVPVDMSKVLFITTANSKDTIPGPLYDRMEVVNLSGYVLEEKIAIAQQYLIPQAEKHSGVETGSYDITEDALTTLIGRYCRESGVRNLQKHIEKVFRKIAYKIVTGEKDKIVVNKEHLRDYVGPPVFTSDRLYDVTPPGVVMGLAWTPMGGATLYIETQITSGFKPRPKAGEDEVEFPASDDKKDEDGNSGRAGLIVTGQLGDVMKESSSLAYSYAKRFVAENFAKNHFFDNASLHLHVPAGATPKDGPSAGVTMVTSMVSLATDKEVDPDIAMTGEISLTGKVLPVGGIKEKIIAAKREGVKRIIMPEENRKDYDELLDFIRKDIDVYFAKTYQDVYNVAFSQSK
eukprot:Clim_evm10s145 gene=Clim_evmTU10s145